MGLATYRMNSRTASIDRDLPGTEPGDHGPVVNRGYAMTGQKVDECLRSRWIDRITRFLAIAALVVTGSFAAVGTASASSVRVTQGEAQSILNAFGNGGWAILVNGGGTVQAGGPADSELRASIRPFSFYSGRHYCVDDWHVLLIAWIAGGDSSYTYEDAVAELSTIDTTLKLDGVSLSTTRTDIKSFLNPERFGLEVAYYFQVGTLVAPGGLTVGTHVLSEVSSDGGKGKAKFYVDASGTGACL
jgi:hypothetical protein